MARVSKSKEHPLGLGGAWAIAVGGMIGGGIFSTLGVVISVAGQWAWLSFFMGGVVALASGHSYSALTRKINKPGGSYAYLREIGWNRIALAVVWILIAGYTLTVSVYAVTFGAYAANAFAAPEWIKLFAAISAIVVLAGVNLMGAAEATMLELIAVGGKQLILLGLAGFGLWHWSPEKLVLDPAQPVGFQASLVGMGVVFMAFEGFQLLSYDYDEMSDAPRTIRIAMPAAILVTMATYVMVALGATMLAGARAIVEQEEVALAIAGREALGLFGFIAISVAATFSAGSAINATVFATARLAEKSGTRWRIAFSFCQKGGSQRPLVRDSGDFRCRYSACIDWQYLGARRVSQPRLPDDLCARQLAGDPSAGWHSLGVGKRFGRFSRGRRHVVIVSARAGLTLRSVARIANARLLQCNALRIEGSV